MAVSEVKTAKAPAAKAQAALPASQNDRRRKKKKGRGGLIALIVILIIVGAAAALLYFNVYNLRDMTYGLLRGVPFIGNFIPDTEEPGRFDGMSNNELVGNIESLERREESLTVERDGLQETIEALQRENDRLREFETNQEQFKLDRDDFDNQVYLTDPQRFWDWYKQMNPEKADTLAREAAGLVQNDTEIKDYLNMIRTEDEKSSAEAMDILMDTDADLVNRIIRNLDSDTAAAILDNMDPTKRAALIRMTDPGIIE